MQNANTGDAGGSTKLITNALELAKNGDSSAVLSEAFFNAVKAVREQNEQYYILSVKPVIKSLKRTDPPITLTDIDRFSKPARKAKQQGFNGDGEPGSEPRQEKTGAFIEFVVGGFAKKLFCDELGNVFADVLVSNVDKETGEELPQHLATWPIESEDFKGEASRVFYRKFGITVGESSLKDALTVISSEAKRLSPEKVYSRCGESLDHQTIYIDTANRDNEVVEVSSDGWCVISSENCPVKFRRSNQARPLPVPERGSDINLLWDHVNVTNEDDRLLILAWLLDCLRVSTEYPLLEIIGSQGSAKSSVQARLGKLIDPSASELSGQPATVEDLAVSCYNSHLVSLDNMGGITTAISNQMCSMVTGGVFRKRKLFSSVGETVIDIRKPLVLNGIAPIVNQPDLAQRTVGVEVFKTKRISRSELEEPWLRDYPKILGALYQLLADSLRDLRVIDHPNNLPRLGDYGLLGTAMCKALKLKVDFCEIANRCFRNQMVRGVDNSPLAEAVIALVSDVKFLEEYPKGLLAQINYDRYRPRQMDSRLWPKSPEQLSRLLRKLEPVLPMRGVTVSRKPVRGNRTLITLERIEVPEG